MTNPDFCEPCGPAPCSGECKGDVDDSPFCDGCGGWADPYTAVECWACVSRHCEDCISEHGWPCSHFAADHG